MRDENRPVSIVGTAVRLPERTISVREAFRQEGMEYDRAAADALGMEQVHVFEGAWTTRLAREAAVSCMAEAGVKPAEIDAVVDFSVLPQDYVVPSWSISNVIQHELGLANAFNLGFGGSGTTNFLVALKFVASLIRSGRVGTALLIATDVALPGNRVVGRERPLTVLGDGASAVLVRSGPGRCEIVGIELWSEGRNHDVFLIPGGGLANPGRLDLYGLRIDAARCSGDGVRRNLREVAERAAGTAGIRLEDVAIVVNPNISAADREECAAMAGFADDDPFGGNRRRIGHVQGTDFVINLSQWIDSGKHGPSRPALVCSHGWGFAYGAMVVRT